MADIQNLVTAEYGELRGFVRSLPWRGDNAMAPFDLAQQLGERGLAGAVLFDEKRVLYYTGFAFIPTERPIAFAIATVPAR